MLFIEFHTIVVRDKVPIQAAHKAFLAIDEYRDVSPPLPREPTQTTAIGAAGQPSHKGSVAKTCANGFGGKTLD